MISALQAAYNSLIEDHGTVHNTGATVPLPTTASPQLVEFDVDDMIEEAIDNINQAEYTGFTPIVSKNEIPLSKLEPEPLPDGIFPEEALVSLCITDHYSGKLTIATPTSNTAVFPGSVLADKNRIPIARVLDVFGPISRPFIVLKGKLPLHMELFAVKPESQFADPDVLEKLYPGSDASNRFDEPVSPEEQDFSDDDEELAAKRARKRGNEYERNTSSELPSTISWE